MRGEERRTREAVRLGMASRLLPPALATVLQGGKDRANGLNFSTAEEGRSLLGCYRVAWPNGEKVTRVLEVSMDGASLSTEKVLSATSIGRRAMVSSAMDPTKIEAAFI